VERVNAVPRPAPPEPPSRFPDPRGAPADEPLAYGGDFGTDLLLDAYRHGIFPWPSGRQLYWWSPDPRALIPVGGVHVSRSLRRVLRSGRFRTTADEAFLEVVRACADRPGEGTWIVPGLVRGYLALHERGSAHSIEVWQDERLVGGIFGVAVGAAFTGESMFHRVSNASKVALVRLDEHLAARGFTLLDAQLPTAHLASLGARSVPRAAFLERLAEARTQPRAF
jgi:leucyl/phenylalanyl-tRNA---protein transferase